MKKESVERGFMKTLPEGTYTRSQVARILGKSKDTIRRWHYNGTYASTRREPFGDIYVWLYTDEDIAAMKKIAQGLLPGPKPHQKEVNQ